MTSYEQRCCGRMGPGPISSGNPETTCQHDFFIVRRDRVTGETDHVPHLTPAPLLHRMTITMDEWKSGLPTDLRPVPKAEWRSDRAGEHEALIHDRLWRLLKLGKSWHVCYDQATHRPAGDVWRYWISIGDPVRTLEMAKRQAERYARDMDGKE